MATPIWALALCRFGARGTNVRPLRDQLRRQADRQIARQPERCEFEPLRQPIAGEAAAQRRQQVALLRQLFLQQGQGLLNLRQRGFLGGDVGLGHLAKRALAPQQVEHVGLNLDDPLRRCDLAAQRGLLHGGPRQIRGQCEIGRLKLEALLVRLRRQRLDGATGAAEDIRRIGYVQLSGEEIEGRRIGADIGRRGDRGLLPDRADIGIEGRQQRTLLRVEVLLRGPQRCLRRREIRTCRERGVDQAVERLGME
jgi:hypothetical protein